MTDEDFEALVLQGIEGISPELRARMKNIAIVIADVPTDEQLPRHAKEYGEVLFGLYEGVPLTERGVEEPVYPDKITIFKEAILSTYHTPEDIAACVANTVWHEVAHHFGYDEEWIAAEELKRGRVL